MLRRDFLAVLATAPFAPAPDNDYAWLIYEDPETVIASGVLGLPVWRVLREVPLAERPRCEPNKRRKRGGVSAR
jgi:hypothetical protein